MRRSKVLVTVSFVILGVACSDVAEKRRYSISDSKAYEASMFRQNCAICHGPEGEGKTLQDGRQIPNLRAGEFKYKTDAEIYRHISEGGNGMIPFRGQLTERELNMMVRFVQDELRRQNAKR